MGTEALVAGKRQKYV